MRQNMTNGERMLSIIGGLAFTSLGFSNRWRGTFFGNVTAVVGVKNTLAGLMGYNPLLGMNDK